MDDSINQNNFESYRKVFAGRKNPNDCPIRGSSRFNFLYYSHIYLPSTLRKYIFKLRAPSL